LPNGPLDALDVAIHGISTHREAPVSSKRSGADGRAARQNAGRSDEMTGFDDAQQAGLRDRALSLGATYFGVADLAPVRDFVTAQGGDFVGDYRHGVSMGIVLSDGVVDQLYQHASRPIARTYHHHIYTVVGEMLDRMATTVAFEIERAGYRALPVPAGRPYNDERLLGLVSHKLAAHLAGHGWIGKNCLLITREHGPRVRWVTVLTDAPLTPTGGALAPVRGDECKGCSICVDLCPAQAFTGIPFDPAENVELRFHRSECKQYLGQRDKGYGAGVCGVCVYVCPHGWSVKRKQDGQHTTPGTLRRHLTGARLAFEESVQPKPTAPTGR
jgi:epoxyqueuosine reductase